jgi:hypothetical protein
MVCLVLVLAALMTGCMTGSSAPPTPTPVDVWKLLEQRPLRIPTLPAGKPCPVTQKPMLFYFNSTSESVPVFARLTAYPFADAQYFANGNPHNDGWGGQKVLWLVQSYFGPVLIRGHQIGGPHVLRFNGGIDQQYYTGDWAMAPLLSMMRLVGSADSNYPNGWPSYTRAQVPGCYIYQVDGLTFSGYLIVQVVFSNTI